MGAMEKYIHWPRVLLDQERLSLLSLFIKTIFAG